MALPANPQVQRNLAAALDPSTASGADGGALTATLRITNADGQPLVRCTSPWLQDLGRKIIAAPSPPPPAPPMPPAAPPRIIGGGRLKLEDFVNVTNAASAALSQLMTKAQSTIGTAATVAAAAAVGAAAGGAAAGSAAGGRGPGGAVSAVQGAQRLSNFGKIGGPPPDGDLGDGGGWTGGRLGFGRSADGSRRRRLQSRGGGSGSSGSSSSGGGRGSSDEPVTDPVAEVRTDLYMD